MPETPTQPKTITEIIDRIERLREELHIVQNALEEMEPKKPEAPASGRLNAAFVAGIHAKRATMSRANLRRHLRLRRSSGR